MKKKEIVVCVEPLCRRHFDLNKEAHSTDIDKDGKIIGHRCMQCLLKKIKDVKWIKPL